jgi:hypothetical protein
VSAVGCDGGDRRAHVAGTEDGEVCHEELLETR